MSGNLARRRQTKFMPADSKLIEARPPAAQGSVRRVARSHHLLRLLGPRLRLRRPGQLSDKLDAAASADAAARASANPCVSGGSRTKREHFLDRLRRLPSRADIHDLELRLGERMDSLAVRFDRAFDPHLS
jgi:hypothetical protein